ncbi:Uu.00g033960.m01.CDS01 [Anthostomella pinea]|uniref:Uu.00g033960.m01.CDS01 n=1 Tax=Anthostomella pinea TaxID=933095 RepID=A0AAI8V428_9PEZI|nr:Uu.00g033960.m01.CDS01 [Anthostomella pinea]
MPGPPPLAPALQRSIDATKVDYVNLGQSGLRVSVPILGGMSLGSKEWAPWVLDEDDSLQILKAAYDRGINTWDTANAYSNGLSEKVIGKALKHFGIQREKVVIMTKCFMPVGEESNLHVPPPVASQSVDYVNQAGLSRGAILKAVDASLKRLDTTYIDVLQLHRFDDSTPIEETMEALHDLVRSGKVHYIGASSMWATQFAQMQFVAEKNGWTKFISMQNYYNLCYREEEREMIRFCKATGVGLIPWSPLYSGRLARPLSSSRTLRSDMPNPLDPTMTDVDRAIIARVEELATKKGWKMSHVGLIWLRMKGAIPITGFNSVERVEEACELRGKTLTDDEIQYLEELYVPKTARGNF